MEEVLKTENTNNNIEEKQHEVKKTEVQEESFQEKNWREFREGRKKDRERLEEEAKAREEEARAREKAQKEAQALKAALEAAVSKPEKGALDYFDEEEERIAKLVEKKLAEKERLIEERRKQEEQAKLPQKIRQAHPDFERVCNAENIDYLEYHYPEIAAAFSQMPDSIDKWTNVYKAIKRFVPNHNSAQNQQRADQNLRKPQSPSIAQPASGAPSVRISEQKKMENWRRMQSEIKSL